MLDAKQFKNNSIKQNKLNITTDSIQEPNNVANKDYVDSSKSIERQSIEDNNLNVLDSGYSDISLINSDGISQQPITGSGVDVYLNGKLVPSGTRSFDSGFFSPDGVIRRRKGDEMEGDDFYWKVKQSGYPTDTDDKLSYKYITNNKEYETYSPNTIFTIDEFNGSRLITLDMVDGEFTTLNYLYRYYGIEFNFNYQIGVGSGVDSGKFIFDMDDANSERFVFENIGDINTFAQTFNPIGSSLTFNINIEYVSIDGTNCLKFTRDINAHSLLELDFSNYSIIISNGTSIAQYYLGTTKYINVLRDCTNFNGKTIKNDDFTTTIDTNNESILNVSKVSMDGDYFSYSSSVSGVLPKIYLYRFDGITYNKIFEDDCSTYLNMDIADNVDGFNTYINNNRLYVRGIDNTTNENLIVFDINGDNVTYSQNLSSINGNGLNYAFSISFNDDYVYIGDVETNNGEVIIYNQNDLTLNNILSIGNSSGAFGKYLACTNDFLFISLEDTQNEYKIFDIPSLTLTQNINITEVNRITVNVDTLIIYDDVTYSIIYRLNESNTWELYNDNISGIFIDISKYRYPNYTSYSILKSLL